MTSESATAQITRCTSNAWILMIFNWSQSILITNLEFFGCGGNQVVNVDRLVGHNSSFVGLVIAVSSYSLRFSKLIGSKDPVATLATLILLSYAKIFQVRFESLSVGILKYPDGSSKAVWLRECFYYLNDHPSTHMA